MAAMFADDAAARRKAAENDELIYEFYDMGVPPTSGDIAYGTSIVYPGRIGDEYYMTKGHFHKVLDTGEIYFCLSGQGYMLMENPEGDVQWEKFVPGQGVYVPRPLRASKHQHQRHRAADHLLRLPRPRGPRLRNHREEGLPQAVHGGAGRPGVRGQPEVEG